MAATTAPSLHTSPGLNVDFSFSNAWDTVSSFVTEFPSSFFALSNLMQYSMVGVILFTVISAVATRRDAHLIANTSFGLIIVSLTAMMAGLAGHEVPPYVTIAATWGWDWFSAFAPLAQASLAAITAFLIIGFTFGGRNSKAAHIVGCTAILGIIAGVFLFIFSLSGHTFGDIKALF